MLVGTNYSKNKLYRGIKHSDGMPLMSEDIHEAMDTLYMKNAYLMNNLLGCGNLNEPPLTISSDADKGISLDTPLVVLIDGDIVLVDSSNYILRTSDVIESSVSSGVLCVVGWYQYIDSTATLFEYGGVNNDHLENDIAYDINGSKLQISSRYQFRWDTVIIEDEVFNSESNIISFNLKKRDIEGNLISGETSISTYDRIKDVRIAHKPSSMHYAASDLYIVPVISYDYVNEVFSKALVWESIKVGTENKRYTHTVVIQSTNTTESNISLSIGINSYKEGDILDVTYNGLLLTEGTQYTIDHEKKTVTLRGFTTNAGDEVTFRSIAGGINVSGGTTITSSEVILF